MLGTCATVREPNFELLKLLVTRSIVGLPTAAGALLWVGNLARRGNSTFIDRNFRTLESERSRDRKYNRKRIQWQESTNSLSI